MTVTVINSNVVGADNAVYLLSGDQFIVNQGYSFITWTTGFDAGVLGSAVSKGVGVTILGNYIAVDLALFGGDRITVGRLGSLQVSDPTGIALTADLADGITSLINEGSIHSGYASGSDAITVTLSDSMALAAAGVTLTNTGLIEATSHALFLTGIGKATVLNTGTIIGTIGSQAPTVDLHNSGLIVGQIQLDAGADRIINTGTINGDIDTGAGNDVIDLRHGRILGTHVVDGGTGDDTYYLDRSSVVLVDGSGQDRVFAAADYTLGAGFETLTLLEGATRGTGSADANVITGNSGDNRLSGELGNDTVFGLLGDDVLIGDQGADDLDGGSGNDRIYGGQLTDRLYGGDGEDLIVGGAGRDSLWGGQDADVFVFNRLNHTLAANPDQISDFVSNEDVIDLSGMDANTTNTSPNDAFTYLGTAAFTHVAGQVRHEVIGTTTWVRMDVNGDAVADGVIRLVGAVVLTATDFVL